MASDAGHRSRLRFDWAWLVAPLPYVALLGLEMQLAPWRRAAFDAALLFALMAAHATCYALWQPHAPRRILVNEALTRLWFAIYAVLVADMLGRDAAFVAAAAVAWAGFTWLLHRNLVRRGYAVAENVTMLGVFLVGLVAILVLA